MSAFGFETTAEEVAVALSDRIKGKVVLTTGVSPNGIGAAFVVAVAKAAPKLLILAARDAKKIEETATAIRSASPNTVTRALILDLNSQAAVRKAADEVNAWSDVPVVDVLVNNAGVMAAPYGPNVDGLDNQFGTNHIGHFLFTNLIMSKIMKSGSPRIVNVASDGARLGPIRFQDYNFDNGKTFDTWRAYGQSKTANILFSRSLATKLGPRGLISFSVHPGVISTPLVRYMGEDGFKALLKIDRDDGFTDYWNGFEHLTKTPEGGAATQTRAAFDDTLNEHNGAYLQNCQIVPPEKIWPWARDDIGAEMLWKLSEKIVKQDFNY